MKNYKHTTDSGLAAQGEELFKEKNCLSCHAVEPNDKRAEAAERLRTSLPSVNGSKWPALRMRIKRI